MPNEPHIYGEPLTGLFSLLRNLRVAYKEYDRDVYALHRVEIPMFAVRIRITDNDNPFKTDEEDGWTLLFYDKHGTTSFDERFREHLFFTLVSMGYMVFLRTEHAGVYRRTLTNTWGRRIVDKRLSEWENRADRAYLYKWTKDTANEFSISELIDRHPGFFDFLYY